MEPVEVSVVQFASADGTVLEGDLLVPADATGSAVVCHPHPLYGGSRHGGGAERDDLRAAIEALDPGEAPLKIAGYHFGADIALSVEHPAADRWIVVAPPVAADALVAPSDPRPVTVIAAAHDQFNSPEQLRPRMANWTNATLHVVESADHFFAGAHRQVSELAAALR